MLVLLGCSLTSGLYSTTADVKLAAEKLRSDFDNLGEAIKTSTQEQANATITKMKTWVQQQEDIFRNAQAKLQGDIEQTRETTKAKINAIANAVETDDEAKANALLKQLDTEINSNLQKLQESAKAIQDKVEAAQTEVKTKWSKGLEELKAKNQSNLKKFNDSLNETKSYFRGFRDIIKRNVAKHLIEE